MDDDFALGSSVWGATEQLAISVPSPLLSQPSPAPSSSQDGFDNFDDFGTPAETIAASGDEADDDFGDFGDFGEGTQADFVSESFEEEVSTPRPTGVAPLDWSPLQLDPIPSRPDLQRQLEHIAGPLWYSGAPSDFIGDPIRQAEGLNQTLVTPERYFPLYKYFTCSYLKSQISIVVNCMICYYQPLSQPSSRSIGRVRVSAGSTSSRSVFQ